MSTTSFATGPKSPVAQPMAWATDLVPTSYPLAEYADAITDARSLRAPRIAIKVEQ